MSSIPASAAPAETPLSPEVQAYYDDKRLMWRNIGWLTLLNIGWSTCFTIIGPLMTLRMNSPEVGMAEGAIGLINSINGYVVSFLVMYFSWKSDHTVSRWGRRIPYLWISTPFILASIVFFPFTTDVRIIIALTIIKFLFMDLKNSTISLLPIDLVPRHFLARTQSIQGIVNGLLGFFVLRYGMRLSDADEHLPYLLAGCVLLVSSVTAGVFIREPPIRNPTTESFKPWSAIQVGWRDRRMIVLMVAATMLGSLPGLYNAWIWLFAKNELGLSRTDMGDALSWANVVGLAFAYPCAWLIDRMDPFKLLAAYLLGQAVLLALLLRVHDATTLTVVAFAWPVTLCFGGAASIMIFRAASPKDVGSITSSWAFINNAYYATLTLVSGYLIEGFGGNYRIAFYLGFGLALVGFGVLQYYRRLMRNRPAAGKAEAIQ